VTADQVPQQLVGKTFTYTDAAGNRQTYTITKDDEITARELVVYPLPRASDPTVLEFHLAWEAMVGRPPRLLAYLDAVTKEVIGGAQFSQP
jgi:hypothetical protein